MLRTALRALARKEVFRWLFLLELSDLLLDVFLAFLALYFVDEVGTSVASGIVLTVSALLPLNAVLPLAIAALAQRFGLGIALWPLRGAPVALLLLVPRRSR